MTRIASEGEAMGFDYLTLTDHVVLPDTKVPGYPYSEIRRVLRGRAARAARADRRHGLDRGEDLAHPPGAAVLVVPHRPAVLAAKMLATLDVLSGGRLVVGIGAGWLKTEFDAVVTTPFEERGAVTDEYIDTFRMLWTEASAALRPASTCTLDGIVLEPKPVQKPLRRSGSAARPARPCAAPRASAMPGTRSAPTTSTCSTRCRG